MENDRPDYSKKQKTLQARVKPFVVKTLKIGTNEFKMQSERKAVLRAEKDKVAML